MSNPPEPLSLRIGHLELRTCDENLLQRRELVTAEVIRWEKQTDKPGEYCYVLAMWRRSKEGYSMEFIGGRPFDAPQDVFWRLAKFGQEFLDRAFEEGRA